ncbi:MAG: 4Fe-4S binding protein [Pseudomonadota bacterium]
MQPKKSFATVNYDICSPGTCNPYEGRCTAVKACTHKVIKQIDGVFEQPMVFHDMCMGCWDCIEACPLDAVYVKNVT